VVVEPWLERCSAAGDGGLNCAPVADDALVGGQAMSVPGLMPLLTSLRASLASVRPLQVRLAPMSWDGTLTVEGNGWVGTQATLSVSWCLTAPPGQPTPGCGGPPLTKLSVVHVGGDGWFSFMGRLPAARPQDTFGFTIVASDGVREAQVALSVE